MASVGIPEKDEVVPVVFVAVKSDPDQDIQLGKLIDGEVLMCDQRPDRFEPGILDVSANPISLGRIQNGIDSGKRRGSLEMLPYQN